MRALTEGELRHVSGAKITSVSTQLNGGGNTPKGEANGVPVVTTNVNPTGYAPPGQN